MCLNTKMSKKYQEQYAEQSYGWKVFRKSPSGGLVGEFQNECDKRPIGRMLDEADFRTYFLSTLPYGGATNRTYPRGWHIFLLEIDALAWVGGASWLTVRRVKFEEPLAYGRQDGLPCVVAKRMKILKESDENPTSSI